MPWVCVPSITSVPFWVRAPPRTVHLNGAHMNCGELVEYRHHASGATTLFDNLESTDEAGPFVGREMFGIFADAGANIHRFCAERSSHSVSRTLLAVSIGLRSTCSYTGWDERTLDAIPSTSHRSEGKSKELSKKRVLRI
jgi:hypothetical protein